LNSFAESLKSQHSGGKTVRELAAEYEVDLPEDFPETLFGERDLEWFRS
jgi:hypothetical protein